MDLVQPINMADIVCHGVVPVKIIFQVAILCIVSQVWNFNFNTVIIHKVIH